MGDDDVEVSEEYLIGCVTSLKRRSQGRADRDRIREDFNLMRGLDKYERELNLISKMDENALTCLIATTLDLSKEVKRMKRILERIRYANFDDDQTKSQATKAQIASGIMKKISALLKPKKRVYKIGNLFKGIE